MDPVQGGVAGVPAGFQQPWPRFGQRCKRMGAILNSWLWKERMPAYA
jgi:hypothetical protein